MATISFTFDRYGNRVGLPAEPTQATVDAAVTASAAVATTTVAADVATLVADGASPTQAHVNTLNTDWAALLTLINTSKTNTALLSTFTAPPTTGAKIVIDTGMTKNQAIAVLEAALVEVRRSAALS